MSMAKIQIKQLSDIESVASPPPGLMTTGSVKTSPMIEKNSISIGLYYLELEAGAKVTCDRPVSDLCLYVLEGEFEANEEVIGDGGCIIAEHGVTATLCSPDGGLCAVFVDYDPVGKAGSNLHYIDSSAVPRAERTPDFEEIGSCLIADSRCPTCNLWLHGNSYREGFKVGLHSHSEDEIILVISGEIVFGNRRHGPHTAIAIGRDTIYSFTAGAGGMSFVNFRAATPTATMRGADTSTDEGHFFRSRLGSPQHTFVLSKSPGK